MVDVSEILQEKLSLFYYRNIQSPQSGIINPVILNYYIVIVEEYEINSDGQYGIEKTILW